MPGLVSVFVNCPFDKDYLPLFRAIVFTVGRCGFQPRCALELVDSSAARIKKIMEIIEQCPLGVHDISRTELDAINGLPRFNMPLELGLFLGAKEYGDHIQKAKRCLVLDREPYRFQKFISDIAGQDVDHHDQNIELVIAKVRSFLNTTHENKPLPHGTEILADYNRFSAELPAIIQRLRLFNDEIEFRDFAWMVAEFAQQNPL